MDEHVNICIYEMKIDSHAVNSNKISNYRNNYC